MYRFTIPIEVGHTVSRLKKEYDTHDPGERGPWVTPIGPGLVLGTFPLGGMEFRENRILLLASYLAL
jgi:hypothetical protein